MSNDYYNNLNNSLVTGETARASDVENKFEEVRIGFDLLPDLENINSGTIAFAEDTGIANTYLVAMPQTATAYVDGFSVITRIKTTNTGSSTLNVDSLGAKSIKTPNGNDLSAGYLEAGEISCFRYDEDNDFFVLTSMPAISHDKIATLETEMNSAQADIILLGSAELPGQSGNSGKYLKTDGSTASWNGDVAASGVNSDITSMTGLDDSGIPASAIGPEIINALGDLGGGTADIDFEDGNVVTATVSTAEQTFTFSNPPATGTNGSFTLILTNGGSQTVNWPASVDWPEATAPTLTAAGVDVLVFTTIDAGTTYLGFVAGLDVS